MGGNEKKEDEKRETFGVWPTLQWFERRSAHPTDSTAAERQSRPVIHFNLSSYIASRDLLRSQASAYKLQVYADGHEFAMSSRTA